MCYETRLKLGKEPACTSACPEQATLFGDRDTLLAEAKRRLEAEPTRYVQQVFGEHEVGGTSVLYLAPVDLSFLQLGRRLDDRPLPDRTVLAMSAVPPTFVGVGALMGGLRWIIGRRIKLAKEQQGATAGHGADTQPPSSTREG
jgi:formate dehydrogenase iron-sulfur subunit